MAIVFILVKLLNYYIYQTIVNKILVTIRMYTFIV